jgi:FMN phosphatase YigB (HAD superfamily)
VESVNRDGHFREGGRPEGEPLNWMQALARHHERQRAAHPDDELLILFDIDGTIVDVQYKIFYLLRAFDREQGTQFFAQLRPEDVACHENQLEAFLERWGCPPKRIPDILKWYREHRWHPMAVLTAHRPYRGVMEVIRWFQIQPKTHVGINTGTPETYREETLRMLNTIGRAYMVRFRDELVAMNPRGWEEGVLEAKVEAIERFRRLGYRPIAMVDNEPKYLEAIAEKDPDGEILLLQADMILKSAQPLPRANTAVGESYDITELIREKDLPRHVEFVWHGLNDEANLRQFLATEIPWAECDVRSGPGGEVILRHDALEERPAETGERWLELADVLDRLERFGKGVKIDLKEAGGLLDRVVAMLKGRRWPVDKLWINGDVDVLGKAGFQRLAREFPGAVLQCPVDFLVPLVRRMPDEGRRILGKLEGWGVNRFSVSWHVYRLAEFVERMREWGLEVNVYAVPDLEAFLKAVLLQPRSITSDFNFPKWQYYGRGSGEKARRYEYDLRDGPKEGR